MGSPHSILSWVVRDPSRAALVRRWLPQGLRDWANRLTGHAIVYRGPYPDWESAARHAAGYDDAALIERLADAARASRQEPGAWEQDGVLRSGVAPDFPLLYALLYVACARERQSLSVLDFGGGFGSTYFQCRRYLPPRSLDWRIVEQPNVVRAARPLAGGQFSYFETLDAALAAGVPDVVVLSSVLQYLRDPYALLDELCRGRIPYLLIDRHPFSLGAEALAVQVMRKAPYRASYPSWLFDRRRFFAALAPAFDLLAQWEGKDPPIRGPGGLGASFHGFLLKRRAPA